MEPPDLPSPKNASTAGPAGSASNLSWEINTPTSQSLASRRPSLAPSMFIDLPGNNDGALDAIHNASSMNPGLTTFGLGSPTPRDSEQLTLNRLFGRVKSVAQGVREVMRDVVAVGGGAAVANALNIGGSPADERSSLNLERQDQESPLPSPALRDDAVSMRSGATKRKFFGFSSGGQPFYQRHQRNASSNVSITSTSSAAEGGYGLSGRRTAPTSAPMLDTAMNTSDTGQTNVQSPYSTSGVIQFPDTHFGSPGSEMRSPRSPLFGNDDPVYGEDDDYEGDTSSEDEDGRGSDEDVVFVSERDKKKSKRDHGNDYSKDQMGVDFPSPSIKDNSPLPPMRANSVAQSTMLVKDLPVKVEPADINARKKARIDKPKRPKPVSRLSENHLLPGFAVVQDSDDSDSSPTTGSVAATNTAGDSKSSDGAAQATGSAQKQEAQAETQPRNESGGSLGFASWFRSGKTTNPQNTSLPDNSVTLSKGVGIGSRSGFDGNSVAVSTALRQLRSGNLSKDYWMKDEACKECFLCSATFTAWRRRHHCRICGQIFCSKCTTLIPGDKFNYRGQMRVCLSCKHAVDVLNEIEETSSDDGYQQAVAQSLVDAHDVPSSSTPQKLSISPTATPIFSMSADLKPTSTPLMAIPATRSLAGNPNRRSAILEIGDVTQIQRPTSAHSNSGGHGMSRPLTAQSMKPGHHPSQKGHNRHASRSQRYSSSPIHKPHIAPFHRNLHFARQKKNHHIFNDNYTIDPELADYISDVEKTDDEQPMSIFEAIAPRFVDDKGKPINKASDRDSKSTANASSSANHAAPVRARSRSRHMRNGGGSIGSALDLTLSRSGGEGGGTGSIGKRMGSQRARKRNASFVGAPLARPVTRGRSHRSSIRPLAAATENSNQTTLPLNAPSSKHIRDMLQQLLEDDEVPNVSTWKEILYPILLKATDDVTLDIRNGDDMNIRQYMKIKRIPGGKPSNTSYVSGIVFSKNLAHKNMARDIIDPKILIISFPIEYSRGQQFMSLEPVIAQERQYLQNLVNRIIALRPSVLLAQHNISRLALQFLEEAGIATAYNVKQSVIEAVARCSQADIFSSVDKLALATFRLGRCERFTVTTYCSPKIPGRKKTFIYISGCKKELGCTIVLRGEDMRTLAKIKRITELMTYVVYSLKLETSLMMDEFAAVPSSTPGVLGPSGGFFLGSEPPQVPEESSKALKGPPAKEVDDKTVEGEDVANNASQTDIAPEDVVRETTPTPTFYEDMVLKHESKLISSSPFVKYMQPYLLEKAREHEKRLIELKALRDRDIKLKEELERDEKINRNFLLVQPEMLQGDLRNTNPKVLEVLLAIHDAEYDKAYHTYQTQKRQWEAYLSQFGDLFDPFAHQSMVFLYSLICTKTSIPCLGPELIRVYYYEQHMGWPDNDSDCTLGQFIQSTVYTAHDDCLSGICNQRMMDHHRSYVHGAARISVLTSDKIACPIRGMEHQILMWSYCKICTNKNTPVIVMSESTWKYSFAKYLELSFWCKDMKLRAGICPHDLHREHVRCFAYDGWTVMFQYDEVDLYEIVVPRTKVTYKPELDLRVKNDQYLQFEDRIKRFYNSIQHRLDTIKMDSVLEEQVEKCAAEIDRLRELAQEELEYHVSVLQGVYTDSLYYQIVPLNQVLREIQQKVIFWEDAFVRFEKDFMPSEKDIRKLASQQLKKIFVDKDPSTPSLVYESLEGKDLSATGSSKATSMKEEGPTPEPGSPPEGSVKEDKKEGTGKGKEKKEDEEVALPVNGSETPPPPPPQSSGSDAKDEGELGQITRVTSEPTVPTVELTPTPTQYVTEESVTETPSMTDSVPASLASSFVKDATESEEPTTPDPEMDSFLKRSGSRGSSTRASFDKQRALPPSGIPRLVDRSARGAPPFVRNQSAPSAPPRVGTAGSSSSTRSAVKKFSDTIHKKAEKYKPKKQEISDRLRSQFPSRKEKVKGDSMVPRSIPSTIGAAKPRTTVFTLTKHFEQISREFEKERRAKQREQRQSRIIVASQPIVEVFANAQEAAEDESDDEAVTTESTPVPAKDGADPLASLGESMETLQKPGDEVVKAESPKEDREAADQAKGAEIMPASGEVEGEASATGEKTEAASITNTIETGEAQTDSFTESSKEQEKPLYEYKEIPKHERNSLMSLLTKFWAEKSSSGWPALEYPLAPNEHVFSDSNVIVREDEPSSLIAFTLSSTSYKQFFESKKATMDGMDPAQDSLEQSLKNPTATHLKYQFSDGNCRMSCKVFYAEHFDALRRKCGLEDRYVESLSRCMKWDSKGGKTKSLFLKSLDDRIVMKALQPVETTAFLKFANSYFSFMSEAFFHELPTVIAKMLGFYQISIRNPVTGTEYKWDIIIMENLFYDRKCARKFDLKGSMRNRYAQETGEQEEVLLDENMVEFIYESPLFVREHAKKLLKISLFNDTLFLAKHNIMDYSLMIGFDEDNKELIVGIIDCIRTYTWDKRIETALKGINAGANKKPTVITPREYKNRFREAMERYILEAPNCWHLFSRMNFIENNPPPVRDDRRESAAAVSDVGISMTEQTPVEELTGNEGAKREGTSPEGERSDGTAQ